MNLEMLMVIAQLCLTPTGSVSKKEIHNMQLNCQKYYVNCVDANSHLRQKYDSNHIALKKCILEKTNE